MLLKIVFLALILGCIDARGRNVSMLADVLALVALFQFRLSSLLLIVGVLLKLISQFYYSVVVKRNDNTKPSLYENIVFTTLSLGGIFLCTAFLLV